MRNLIYAINTTLDGVVDHMKIGPPDQETTHIFIYAFESRIFCGVEEL